LNLKSSRPKQQLRHWRVLVNFYGSPSPAIIRSYARSAIEACPEEEKKRPVLQLLDELRELADRSVRLFSEGRVNELYALMSTSFRKEYTEGRFREYLVASQQRGGKELHYEYRNQFVKDISGSLKTIDQGDYSIVWYALASGADDDVLCASHDASNILTLICSFSSTNS
jgi:hypothetical protein